MLIVSKFHDYYDTIKSFGIDKTVVYNRKEERFRFSDGPSMFSDGFFGDRPFTATRLIGFCGKLYPLLQINSTRNGNKIIYDKDETLKRVRDIWYTRDMTRNFLEDVNNKALLRIFVEKKTPLFIYGDYLDGNYSPRKVKEVITNPKLKDWGFQRIKDPVSAFQDIYMYISGVLGTSNIDMPEFSDKLKAQAKGHDDRYSFRKPPGTKRGKPKWR